MPMGKGTKVVWNLNVEVRDEKIDELGGAFQCLDVTALLHVACNPFSATKLMLVIPIASRRPQRSQSTGDMRINV